MSVPTGWWGRGFDDRDFHHVLDCWPSWWQFWQCSHRFLAHPRRHSERSHDCGILFLGRGDEKVIVFDKCAVWKLRTGLGARSCGVQSEPASKITKTNNKMLCDIRLVLGVSSKRWKKLNKTKIKMTHAGSHRVCQNVYGEISLHEILF